MGGGFGEEGGVGKLAVIGSLLRVWRSAPCVRHIAEGGKKHLGVGIFDRRTEIFGDRAVYLTPPPPTCCGVMSVA